MKQFQASVHNIQEDILGIISDKPVLLERNRHIFIGRIDKGKSGYAATLSFSKEVSGCNPVVYNVPESIQLNNGDVVLITPSGLCTVLYEIASAHNAIMATERCNHRCIMCPQPPIVQEKDKTEFNLRLIDLFDSSTQEVGITGGEPTLIGDNLFRLIRHIQKRLPHAAISVLSNGVRFADKDFAKHLALCNHHDIQIDIPLFSDIAEIHNHIVGAKTFYKTIQGLYNLALFRQRIGLRVVVHKQTYNRLPQLADYIYHNFPFVCQVAFMQMETIGLAESNIEQLWIDPFDYQNELREAVLLLRDRGIPSFVYNAQLCVLPEDIREFAVQSISDWKDIYIDECSECVCKGSCAGFFASNRNHHSSHIKALTEPIKEPICLT